MKTCVVQLLHVTQQQDDVGRHDVRATGLQRQQQHQHHNDRHRYWKSERVRVAKKSSNCEGDHSSHYGCIQPEW